MAGCGGCRPCSLVRSARAVKLQCGRELLVRVTVLRRRARRKPASPLHGASPIVSPPQVEPHRWQAPEPARRGLAPLDDNTRALLRAWRARRPPREPWRFRLVLGVVLALHLLFAAVVWWEMQPHVARGVVRVTLHDALQVRFIEAAPALTPPPALPRPTARAAAPATRPRPVAKAPAGVPSAPPAPAPTAPLRLVDRTGQPLLPAPAASAAPAVPGYIQRMPQGDAQVMRHDSPVTYQSTRFNQYFPPPDETVAGQGLRRALSKTHTGEDASVDLGHGVHLKCKTLFGIPTPMCGQPPAPPSKKDGDERLDMAPPPLARELAPARRDLAGCIAIYRAGKPLPHGCPVDTPARAVDAECGEARQAGKPLPAHCLRP